MTKGRAYPVGDTCQLILEMGRANPAGDTCQLILEMGRVNPAGDTCRLILEMGSASCACQIHPLIPTKWKANLASNRGLVTGKVNSVNESATLALRERRVSPGPQCRYSALWAEGVVRVYRNNVRDPRQWDIFPEINSRSRRAQRLLTGFILGLQGKRISRP